MAAFKAAWQGVKELLAIVAQSGDSRLPVDAHASLIVLAAQLQAAQTMIGSIEKRVVRQHRSNEESKRLAAGQQDGKKTALSICDCVDFRIAPTT